jgi:hypothetical protein
VLGTDSIKVGRIIETKDPNLSVDLDERGALDSDYERLFELRTTKGTIKLEAA